MDRSDERLLELALQGDTASFGELIERWQQKIYAFICRYVGNVEEAQDLTQDTFTKAYRNLGRLSDPARFSSWLYKIALNECRMRFRRRRKLQPVSLQDYQDLSERNLKADTATPEAELATKESIRLLREAFADLPEEQKAVILMKEYQELKFHEISEILGVPLSTVKSRMYLGLKTLRKLMETKQ
ncbi:sigma-70 family RNA polymerase sigma factor [Acidobacteria bacterium AH-259-L09]|nr:sigma-70 family RNA polymerase sigma factor [Acidobacteria bacterium AH-259-L09]